MTEPITVFIRVGADNIETELGTFTPDSRPDGHGAFIIVDNDRPLAALLRRAADAIENDGDLPVA